MIVNECILMVFIDNEIRNFGAYVMSETIKMNHTLTSLDMRGEWNKKEVKEKEWIKINNE